MQRVGLGLLGGVTGLIGGTYMGFGFGCIIQHLSSDFPITCAKSGAISGSLIVASYYGGPIGLASWCAVTSGIYYYNDRQALQMNHK